MDRELSIILSENPSYKDAYDTFLEIHKSNYGSTPQELAEFEKFYARDFLNGIKKDNKERKVLIEGERLVLRKACIEDAEFMSRVEKDADNSPWVANWPLGWRIAKFGDGNFLQTILEKKDGTPIGFIIFCDMMNKEKRLQLKRIAIIEKGRGYGKESLYLAQKLAFEVWGTKCLYLGTKEANLRAQSIYKATGFVPDMPDPCTQFHMGVEEYEKNCVCTSPNQDAETIKQMVSEFAVSGVKEKVL